MDANIDNVRVGYGVRDPKLVAALRPLTPLATETVSWPNASGVGAAYAGELPAGVPDYLVTSVRCIVTVGDGVLVCTTPNDSHCVPGGRREPDESWEQTARREVMEETGWELGPLNPLGFFHFNFHFDAELPDDHPYPHPDIVQVVFTADGRSRAAADWRDTQGWEGETRIVPVLEALGLVNTLDQSLLRRLTGSHGRTQ